MSRLLIIEKRRIIPLILLIVLMGGLTFYDNLRDGTGEITPVKDEKARETKTVKEQFEKEVFIEDESKVDFVTADTGFRLSPKNFEIATDLEEWVDIIEANNLNLPDYPYNEYTEVGLFGFNSEIKDIEVLDGDNERLQVNVLIRQKADHYHIVTLPRQKLAREKVQNWRFLNEEGEALYQVTTEIRD